MLHGSLHKSKSKSCVLHSADGLGEAPVLFFKMLRNKKVEAMPMSHRLQLAPLLQKILQVPLALRYITMAPQTDPIKYGIGRLTYDVILKITVHSEVN
jgi:hypothetical protein